LDANPRNQYGRGVSATLLAAGEIADLTRVGFINGVGGCSDMDVETSIQQT
jgi:hypothetical protein